MYIKVKSGTFREKLYNESWTAVDGFLLLKDFVLNIVLFGHNHIPQSNEKTKSCHLN